MDIHGAVNMLWITEVKLLPVTNVMFASLNIEPPMTGGIFYNSHVAIYIWVWSEWSRHNV